MKGTLLALLLPTFLSSALAFGTGMAVASNTPSQAPLFANESQPPLNMLVIGRDHTLFAPAYNNSADLNGDGLIDIGYTPSIDYFGYFDSYKCYDYSDRIFTPKTTTSTKKCSDGYWSGDYLNFLTTSRADALRKVLYGGYRSTYDPASGKAPSKTILERAYIRQDAHTWGSEYTSPEIDGYALSDYVPREFSPTSGRRTLFASTTTGNKSPPLLRVAKNQSGRIWDWVAAETTQANNISNPTDYEVRVQVCKKGTLESNCKQYGGDNYKPTGLLHDFGEAKQMYIGLLTGSYVNNLQGGVLRKAISTQDNIPTMPRFFTASSTSRTQNLNNPLWYTAKWGGYGGFSNAANSAPTDGQWDSEIPGTPNNYYLVTNAGTLKDQLSKAFKQILSDSTAITAPAITSSSSGDGYNVFTTSYDTSRWSGSLKMTSPDGSWEASLPAASKRKIKFRNAKGELEEFTFEALQGIEYGGHQLQSYLNYPESITQSRADNLGAERVNFIRGDRSNEGKTLSNNTTFRQRNALLGDIIHSSPAYVAADALYLPYLATKVDGTPEDYYAFATEVAERTPMIYVGANDGMLHAFNASSGKEAFAFIPRAVIPNLNKLTHSDYSEEGGSHHYYVDGSPIVADVYFDNAWHTLLVGTLRAGGRSIFALNITDPGNIELLWEYGEADADFGYSFATPTVARLHTGKWAVVTGNGYHSPSGKAALYILDAQTGERVTKIIADDSGDNGLSTPKLADNNADGVADYAYAGDLKGNLWRFDLLSAQRPASDPFAKTDNASGSDFKVSYGGNPLYSATRSGEAQAITAPPSLVRHPSMGGYIVIFGTGRYFSDSDKSDQANRSTQSLYGIWDKKTKGEVTESPPPRITISELQRQSFEPQTKTHTAGTAQTVRILSQETVLWKTDDRGSTGKMGWYLDFLLGDDSQGERLVNAMAVRGSTLLAATLVPINADPCAAGIDGWVYGINPHTGGRTNYAVFDLNGDHTVDLEDRITLPHGTTIDASGVTFSGGNFSLKDSKLFDSSGTALTYSPGTEAQGRQSWQILLEAE